ncbi:MAG: hypothetical protein N3C12_02555 [Candidatus Binatia bacterium]|nr:hypothetical protein [Candidatus Binatia bacterium]
MKLRSELGISLIEVAVATAILGATAALLCLTLLRVRELSTMAERLSRALVLAVNAIEQAHVGPTFTVCPREDGYQQSVDIRPFEDRPDLDEVVATIQWSGHSEQRLELRTLIYRPRSGGG